MKTFAFFLFLIVLASFPSRSSAASSPRLPIQAGYYVATNGNNCNSGTLAAPWRTIQYALDQVSAGDVVFVRGGVYNEAVSVNVSGSAGGGYITLQAYPGETPILDGQNSRTVGFYLDNVSHIVIDGFEIRQFKSYSDVLAAGIEIREGSHHIQLRNNKIHSIQANLTNLDEAIANGIGVYGTSNSSVNNILIDSNELYNLTLGWSESLVVSGNVELFTITNNVIHDNDNIGIDVIGGEPWLEEYEGVLPALNQARDGVVADNLVYNIDSATNPVYEGDRSAPCLYVDGGTRVVMERNIVHDCNFGVSIGSENVGHSSSYVTLRHNFIYDSLKAGLVLGGSDFNDNGGAAFNTIVNNTFFANDTVGEGGGELWVQQRVQNTVIKNNIFYATAQNIALSNYNSTAVGNTIDYNLYFAPGGAGGTRWVWRSTNYGSFAAWRAATGFDAHSSFQQPQFVSTATPDLHLQLSSPAVNAGDVLAEATTDIDGEVRAVDCTPDIGADEVLFAVPLVVSNTAQSGTTLTLQWEGVAGSVGYRVYHDTMPYFAVSGVPAWEGSGLAFAGVGHLGSPATNYFYVVQSVNCEMVPTAVSPRFGTFNFAIVPGN